MNRQWTKIVLQAATGGLAFCLIFLLWVSDQGSGPGDPVKTPPFLQAMGTIAIYVVSASTLILWFSEMILRWREEKAEGKWVSERLGTIAWVLILGIFGAYYFAIRRVRKGRE